MAKEPSMKLKKTAYHEAGHAVAACEYRRKFSYVTIAPEEDSLGHVLYQHLGKNFHPEYDEMSKVRAKLEKAILISLAGHAAERIFSGKNNWLGSSNDIHSVVDYAS